MSDDDALALRTALIRQSTEKIEMNYLRARGRGEVDPVVLLLDLLDPRARSIAEQSGQGERIAAMVAEAAHRAERPVVFAGLPPSEACRIAEGLLPDLPGLLASMDAGRGFVVVAVAFGSATAMTMPPVPA